MKLSFLTVLMLLSELSFAGVLKVMQYNTENFFDTSFDRGTEDYVYLPLKLKQSLTGHADYCAQITSNYSRQQCLNLDWTEDKFNRKVMNLARVIKSYDSTGKGPDILILQEVENLNVLNKLIRVGLNGLGRFYPVLIEGDDSRGIDVAVISRFPVLSSRHHSVSLNGEVLDTRGVLEVVLNVEGKRVVVFANHWPSLNNPVDQRIASAKLVSKLAENRKEDLIIAAGDFNSNLEDNPNPLKLLEKFNDVEIDARKINPKLNPGTHYYQGSWSSLDKIFIHQTSNLKPDLLSFEIMLRDFYMKTDSHGVKVPIDSNHQTGEGFSDHLPLKLNFKY
jgi:endonuclease/exonuclease/phosphatase family metal-dependent hydrolase